MKILLKGRNMRTFPERRAASGLLSEKKEFEVEGLPFVRPRRRPSSLRTEYDDICVYDQRNWKSHRLRRWKV
jgi:hypothetical protein